MCDPASLAIASAASTAIGAAGSIAGGIGQANAQKKQANEVAAWQQQQKKAREAEGVRQENLRQEANAARETSVEQLSGDEQAKRQAEEEARLTTYLQGGDQQATPEATPTSVADAELSGQSQGPEDFRSDLAAKINTATKDARKRMAALATVSSYGDSFGGLGTTNKEILGKSGSAIDMANDLRKGSLSAWGAEKAIDPVQVSYSNPLGDAFATALQVGTQGLGNAYGDYSAGQTAKGTFAAAPKASKFVGPAVPLPKKYAYANSGGLPRGLF